GVPLAETGSGVWSGTASLRDQQLIEFKFVKLQGSTPEWEGWQPYDSNRSLRVECTGEGGVLTDAGDGAAPPADAADDAPDAALDAPPADASIADGGVDAPPDTATADAVDATSDSPAPGPARGRSYTGVFGVRPPDATK
ncbi:MAG: hypothetical protein ABW133_23550, partial [Polyangiaceae bacterium]